MNVTKILTAINLVEDCAVEDNSFTIKIVLILIAAGLVGGIIIAYKDEFFKKPLHIIIGLRQKNHLILRDERLVPALWELRVWQIWTIFSTSIVAVIIYISVFRGELFVLDIVISTMITAVFATLLLKSSSNFNRLKDELGVVLDRDEAVLQAIFLEKHKKNQKNIIWLAPLMIFMILISLLNFLVHFREQNLLRSILWVALTVAHTLRLLFYFIEKKRFAKMAIREKAADFEGGNDEVKGGMLE